MNSRFNNNTLTEFEKNKILQSEIMTRKRNKHLILRIKGKHLSFKHSRHKSSY